jgi:hypothetical protein
MLTGELMGRWSRRKPWTFRLWMSRIGEVAVAIADSFLGNFRR